MYWISVRPQIRPANVCPVTVRACLFPLAAVALALCATGARADIYADCNQSKDFDRRISGCTQVIERGDRETAGNRAIAYNSRGDAYYSKGGVDRAIADYSQAIALDPKFAAAYNIRGIAYYRKGEVDRAIADYSRAIALDPKSADSYIDRGNAYEKKDEHDRTIADYTQAIALDPKLVRAYTSRGVAYHSKGNKEQAIADFRMALKIDPSYQEAKKDLDFALKQKP